MAKYQDWLDKDKLILIEGWARDGLTNEQIAKNMGVSESTLYGWQGKYLEISEALKKGKEVVDREVESALLKKAMGYSTEEVVRERINGELVVTKVVVKEIAPDTTAQIFWLKNRKPAEWRDKQDLEVNADMGVRIIDNLVEPR